MQGTDLAAGLFDLIEVSLQSVVRPPIRLGRGTQKADVAVQSGLVDAAPAEGAVVGPVVVRHQTAEVRRLMRVRGHDAREEIEPLPIGGEDGGGGKAEQRCVCVLEELRGHDGRGSGADGAQTGQDQRCSEIDDGQ